MRNPISTSLILFAIVLLSGCVEATFPEPMPFNRANKTFFPSTMQGDWTYKGDSNELEENITVNAQYVDLGDENIVLSDRTVLRKFNGYYILSTYLDKAERYGVLVAKLNGNVLSVYKFDCEDEEKVENWKSILGEESVEVITKDNKGIDIEEVRLNPANNSTFRQLLTKGGLTHIGDYVR